MLQLQQKILLKIHLWRCIENSLLISRIPVCVTYQFGPKLMKIQEIYMRNTGQLSHRNRSGCSTLLICGGWLWSQDTGAGNWSGLLSIILGHSVQMLTSESPCLSEQCFPFSLPTRSLGIYGSEKNISWFPGWYRDSRNVKEIKKEKIWSSLIFFYKLRNGLEALKVTLGSGYTQRLLKVLRNVLSSNSAKLQ